MNSQQKIKLLIPLTIFALLLIPIWIYSSQFRSRSNSQENQPGQVVINQGDARSDFNTTDVYYFGSKSEILATDILTGTEKYKTDVVLKNIDENSVAEIRKNTANLGRNFNTEYIRSVANKDGRSIAVVLRIYNDIGTMNIEFRYSKNPSNEWELVDVVSSRAQVTNER